MNKHSKRQERAQHMAHLNDPGLYCLCTVIPEGFALVHEIRVFYISAALLTELMTRINTGTDSYLLQQPLRQHSLHHIASAFTLSHLSR